MTKDEFIAGYCERSNIEWPELSQHWVALPCACGEPDCDGWAMLPNSPRLIATHNQLYAPAESDPQIQHASQQEGS